MKVGLIDVDGHNYPNLPLMKLSAWHKQNGDRVQWYDAWDGLLEPYDKVYMSKVFSFSPDYDRPIYSREIEKGGSGYCIKLENGREVYDKSQEKSLPYEIEHIYPDYSLYPELTHNTAYGFLTRGCPRGCHFCHVAAKEGQYSHKVADLEEFWRGQKKIILSDPNILGCPEHLDLLQQLVDSKATVDFNQGLDVRLVTEKNLELIKSIRMKYVHLAYDRMQDREIIEPRLKAFKAATGWDHHKVMVYILTNYDTTLEEDLHRIYFCRDLDLDPFVMVYDKANADPIYKKLQRWVNNDIVFWSVPTFDIYLEFKR
jgi:hypothetical protein